MWTLVYVACRLLGYLVPLCVVWTKCGDINRTALARSLFHALCPLGCCHCHLLRFHSVTIWCPPLLCARLCCRLPTDYTPEVQSGGNFVFLHSTSLSLLTVDSGRSTFSLSLLLTLLSCSWVIDDERACFGQTCPIFMCFWPFAATSISACHMQLSAGCWHCGHWIQDAPCGDFMTHFCCHPCANCQEHREIRERSVVIGSSVIDPPPFQTMGVPSSPTSRWFYLLHHGACVLS